MTDTPHVTKKPLSRGEQTRHFFESQTASALCLVPEPGINGRAFSEAGRRQPPSLALCPEGMRPSHADFAKRSGPNLSNRFNEVPYFMLQQPMEWHPSLHPPHSSRLQAVGSSFF